MDLPINKVKKSNKMSQFIKDTTKNLDFYIKNNNLDIPIIFWDEKFYKYRSRNKQKFINNTKKQKKKLDKYAAQIILDDF